MHRELRKHKLAYTLLFLGLALFCLAFLAAWPDRTLQRLAIAGVVGFYFGWGVTTHVKTTTFTKRVALEYGAVALLGGMILLFLTL